MKRHDKSTVRSCYQNQAGRNSDREDDMDMGHGHYHHHNPSPQVYLSNAPPRQWFPWLVPLMFLANTALFVYAMYLNDCPSSSPPAHCLFTDRLGRFSFEPMSENPFLGPRIDTLRKLGALDTKLVLEKHQGWRYVSCIFLHAGVIHLVLNMFSLLVTGVGLEREFGFLRIGLVYVLSGFGGSLLSVMRMKGSAHGRVSVGASGALFGLLGSMLSELFTNWSAYNNKCSALIILVVVIVLNLAVGFLPKVDNSAHLGGFISGFLLGFVFLMRPQYGYVNPRYIPAGYQAKQKSKHSCCQYFFFLIALILAILGYAYVLAEIYLKLPKKYDVTLVPS